MKHYTAKRKSFFQSINDKNIKSCILTWLTRLSTFQRNHLLSLLSLYEEIYLERTLSQQNASVSFCINTKKNVTRLLNFSFSNYPFSLYIVLSFILTQTLPTLSYIHDLFFSKLINHHSITWSLRVHLTWRPFNPITEFLHCVFWSLCVSEKRNKISN